MIAGLLIVAASLLLQLASLRSAFTPDTYGLFPIPWLVVLLLAVVEWPSWRGTVLAALVPLANYIVPTVPIMPLPALFGFGPRAAGGVLQTVREHPGDVSLAFGPHLHSSVTAQVESGRCAG